VTQTKTKPQPVTTDSLPVVRCTICQRPMVHQRRKGAAAAALTEHYNSEHTAEELAAVSA
jgi:hypothetical protein